jgi:hypothetical protein
VLDIELLLQPSTGLEQSIGAVVGDRSALALAPRIKRAAAVAHPRAPACR